MEKSEASRQEEQQRKALEAKAATFEKQILQLQVSSSGRHLSAHSLPTRADCIAGMVPGQSHPFPVMIDSWGCSQCLGLEP